MAAKRYYRSREDRVISGVCGGLGEYFEIDPVIVRIMFVALGFISGIGVGLYLLFVVTTIYRPIRRRDSEDASTVTPEPENKPQQ
ncbi:MAG: PspC domain-containing protein [Candidatus Wallbacteria bacterium]|nr:PspC domain-containing protein [Candidatus Wallbacteria bacterium]